MGSNSGFHSDEHPQRFLRASLATRFGGAGRQICGARSRAGGVCTRVPIREGKGRCLKHAGPHAARLHRERQRQDFLAGKISADEWRRAEARRAANRLGELWKKNPWAPGRTIDLGHAEGALRDELSERGLDVDAIAPAVADWLRWKYRRLVLDARRAGRAGSRWEAVLADELPHRVRKAGTRPLGLCDGAGGPQGRDAMSGPLAPGCALWRADGVQDAASKRFRPDRPKAPPVVRTKGYGRRGRPRTGPADDDEMAALMALYRDHMAVLAPMLERCPTDAHRVMVLRALRDHLNVPQDRTAHVRWQDAVRLYGLPWQP